MSNYYDVVISCDLREDTPEEAINIIRHLTDRDYVLTEKPKMAIENYGDVGDWFFSDRFLAPDPENEVISNFQKMLWLIIPTENNREVYRYSLQYSGRNIHDDFWAEHHIPFVYWLAPYVLGDFIGYMKYTEGGKPDLMYVKNGRLFGDAFNPPDMHNGEKSNSNERT